MANENTMMFDDKMDAKVIKASLPGPSASRGASGDGSVQRPPEGGGASPNLTTTSSIEQDNAVRSPNPNDDGQLRGPSASRGASGDGSRQEPPEGSVQRPPEGEKDGSHQTPPKGEEVLEPHVALAGATHRSSLLRTLLGNTTPASIGENKGHIQALMEELGKLVDQL